MKGAASGRLLMNNENFWNACRLTPQKFCSTVRGWKAGWRERICSWSIWFGFSVCRRRRQGWEDSHAPGPAHRIGMDEDLCSENGMLLSVNAIMYVSVCMIKFKNYGALLAILLLVLGCIGMSMYILVLFYIAYLKSSSLFFVGAVSLLLVFPIFIIAICDLCKSIEDYKSITDKIGCILILLAECTMIYTSIIFFVEYT